MTAPIKKITTKWTMTALDVHGFAGSHQLSGIAFSVTGSKNPVIFALQEPSQNFHVDVSSDDHHVFVAVDTHLSRAPDFEGGMSIFPVVLDTKYFWDGANLVVDKSLPPVDPKLSIQITNKSRAPMTFGITKTDFNTGKQLLICADVLTPLNTPAATNSIIYTPTLTMYAKICRDNIRAGSVINLQDIPNWASFEVSATNNSFKYDAETVAWVSATAPAPPSTPGETTVPSSDIPDSSDPVSPPTHTDPEKMDPDTSGEKAALS